MSLRGCFAILPLLGRSEGSAQFDLLVGDINGGVITQYDGATGDQKASSSRSGTTSLPRRGG